MLETCNTLRSSCQVILDGIEVMANIGTQNSEREILQPLRIFVELDVATPTQDNLEYTFDYSKIASMAREISTMGISLIETFALKLAEKCIEDGIVFGATVRIEKPRAVPGCTAGTRVTLTKF
jgi:7,8-dihydroneopterin aldolase/epimerase/oxygenase